MPGREEVPEGVKRYRIVVGFMEATGDPQLDGGHWIRASDLPLIYKHFSDRLLGDGPIDAAESAIAADDGYGSDRSLALSAVSAALQATSTPEVDRG
jgi:hypothetical protein